jgi:hypothetical protein
MSTINKRGAVRQELDVPGDSFLEEGEKASRLITQCSDSDKEPDHVGLDRSAKKRCATQRPALFGCEGVRHRSFF